MIKEFDTVVIIEELPQYGITKGTLGIVVMIHGNHDAYELEIFDDNYQALDVITAEATQVRLYDSYED